MTVSLSFCVSGTHVWLLSLCCRCYTLIASVIMSYLLQWTDHFYIPIGGIFPDTHFSGDFQLFLIPEAQIARGPLCKLMVLKSNRYSVSSILTAKYQTITWRLWPGTVAQTVIQTKGKTSSIFIYTDRELKTHTKKIYNPNTVSIINIYSVYMPLTMQLIIYSLILEISATQVQVHSTCGGSFVNVLNITSTCFCCHEKTSNFILCRYKNT